MPAMLRTTPEMRSGTIVLHPINVALTSADRTALRVPEKFLELLKLLWSWELVFIIARRSGGCSKSVRGVQFPFGRLWKWTYDIVDWCSVQLLVFHVR